MVLVCMLVRVPFYSRNLWLIPDQQSFCTFQYVSICCMYQWFFFVRDRRMWWASAQRIQRLKKVVAVCVCVCEGSVSVFVCCVYVKGVCLCEKEREWERECVWVLVHNNLLLKHYYCYIAAGNYFYYYIIISIVLTQERSFARGGGRDAWMGGRRDGFKGWFH